MTVKAKRVEVHWLRPPPGGTVTVNQLPAWPRPGETSWDAALRQLRRIASRETEPLQVTVVSAEGVEQSATITQDGQLSTTSSERTQEKRPAVDAEKDTSGSSSGWQPAASSTRNSAASRRRREHREVPWPLVALSVASVLALGAVGVGVTTFLSPDESDAPSATTSADPIAPLGYRDSPSWSTPRLHPKASAVVPSGPYVAFVTDLDQVEVVHGDTGKPLWSADFPEGEVKTGPVLLKVQGRESIVAHVGERLFWWDVATGKPGSVKVPADASLWSHGDGVLLHAKGNGHAYTLSGTKLAQVKIPAGMSAWGARGDGTVLVAGSNGWTTVTPKGIGGPARPFEDPEGGVSTGRKPTVVGYVSYSGGQLVLVWPQSKDAHARVAIYSDTVNLPLAFSAPLPDKLTQGQNTLTWRPSPSESWGVLGDGIIVDFAGAAVRDFGDTQFVSNIYYDRVVGVFHGQRVVAGPTIPLGVLDIREEIPEVVTPDGAFTRDQTGTVSVLPPK